MTGSSFKGSGSSMEMGGDFPAEHDNRGTGETHQQQHRPQEEKEPSNDGESMDEEDDEFYNEDDDDDDDDDDEDYDEFDESDRVPPPMQLRPEYRRMWETLFRRAEDDEGPTAEEIAYLQQRMDLPSNRGLGAYSSISNEGSSQQMPLPRQFPQHHHHPSEASSSSPSQEPPPRRSLEQHLSSPSLAYRVGEYADEALAILEDDDEDEDVEDDDEPDLLSTSASTGGDTHTLDGSGRRRGSWRHHHPFPPR